MVVAGLSLPQTSDGIGLVGMANKDRKVDTPTISELQSSRKLAAHNQIPL